MEEQRAAPSSGNRFSDRTLRYALKGILSIVCLALLIPMGLMAYAVSCDVVNYFEDAVGEARDAAFIQPSQEENFSGAGSLEKLGKQLRAEIDREYRRLKYSHTLKFVGNGRNDLTHILSKYIPDGSSMDRAETILENAGFTLRPRGGGSLIPGDISVIADIKLYKQLFFGRISVIAILEPKDKDDYSIVTHVGGGIIAMMI